MNNRLKELRKEKGLTQKQVAEALEVAPTTIAGYEQGTREPNREMIIKLCKFYQVSADFLLGLSDF